VKSKGLPRSGGGSFFERIKFRFIVPERKKRYNKSEKKFPH
jgi:hypothetical protein